MKKLMAITAVSLIAQFSNAADIPCGPSTVSVVMDYPTSCSGKSVFKLSSGTNGAWICTPSEKGGALVLAALAAQKKVTVYIDNQNGAFTCSTLPAYVTPRYLILYKD